MAIDSFQRDPTFFYYNETSAYNLDLQFNNIVDYLNNKIIIYVNQIINNRFQGSNNNTLLNSFLINVGDGSLKWGFLSLQNFAYNGLSLSKISSIEPNSIIAADDKGRFQYIKAPDHNPHQVLMSNYGNTPVWGLLTNDNFEDRCITGGNVILGSITEANITEDTYNILDNTVDTIKFTDNCVNTDNLIDEGLMPSRLTLNVLAVFDKMITSNMMKDGYIDNYFDTIFGGINIYNLNIADYDRIVDLNSEYPIGKFQNGDVNFISEYSIDNLQPLSINGCRLSYFNTALNAYVPEYNTLILPKSITPEHLDPQLRADLDL